MTRTLTVTLADVAKANERLTSSKIERVTIRCKSTFLCKDTVETPRVEAKSVNEAWKNAISSYLVSS